jgi:hypothetical protein
MDRPLPGFFDDEPPSPPSQPPHATKAETVVLRGVTVSLNSDVGGAFIADCARNRERLVNDAQMCEKYGISSDAWAEIGRNKTP